MFSDYKGCITFNKLTLITKRLPKNSYQQSKVLPMGELSDVPSGSLFLFAKVQIYCIFICLTVTKIVPYSKAFCRLEVIYKIYLIIEMVLERSSRKYEHNSINTNRDQIPMEKIWKRNPGPLTTGAEQPASAAGVTHFYLWEEKNFYFLFRSVLLVQYNSLFVQKTFTFNSGGQKWATEESGSLPQCVRGESRTLLASKQHNWAN